MDSKIINGLKDLSSSSEPVLLKTVGIPKTIANTLEKIGFINLVVLQMSSRPIKTANAASITDFGKSFLFLVENPDITSELRLQRTFKDFFTTVEKTYKDLKELSQRKYENKPKSNFFLTENLVLREIEAKKSSIKSLIELPLLVNNLMEKTKLPRDRIHNYLYQMALNNKVVLQSNEEVKGTPLTTQDGSEYNLIK